MQVSNFSLATMKCLEARNINHCNFFSSSPSNILFSKLSVNALNICFAAGRCGILLTRSVTASGMYHSPCRRCTVRYQWPSTGPFSFQESGGHLYHRVVHCTNSNIFQENFSMARVPRIFGFSIMKTGYGSMPLYFSVLKYEYSDFSTVLARSSITSEKDFVAYCEFWRGAENVFLFSHFFTCPDISVMSLVSFHANTSNST